MNTKHFDYIIAIAETKSLSRAGKRLGISQPVLSRYLSNLEQQLGVKLFYQENRSLHITAAGKIYLNGVKRMKELNTQMYRSFDFLHGVKELTLQIGMSPFRGGQELASFYPKLLNHYPNLNLIVTEGNTHELMEKLYSNKLSVLLNLYDNEFMPNTKIASLIKTEVLIALPTYYPLANALETSLSNPTRLTIQQLCSLNDVPFVYQDSRTVLGQLIEQACYRYGFSPTTLLRTCNSIAITSLLQSGSYAGFVVQNVTEKINHLKFFRFPHSIYLYSGLIFSAGHQPSEVEQMLYQIVYEQAMNATPDLLSVNDLGKRFLNSVY